MSAFKSVLFDFGHTLFDTQPSSWYCDEFARASGRTVGAAAFADTWAAIRDRSRQPDELAKGRDLSADAHRRCWLDLLAPFDQLAPGLARFVYAFECSARGWRPYPDAIDVLTELRSRSISIGVISDTGWDIRGVFMAHGLHDLVDSYDLSCDHGVAKPDRRLFESACSKLGVAPHDALMVGDSWLTDGGAAAHGITTLILPTRDRTSLPALSTVLELTR